MFFFCVIIPIVDRWKVSILPIFQDHVCTLLRDRVHCSLYMSADLQGHDAGVHHSKRLHSIYPQSFINHTPSDTTISAHATSADRVPTILSISSVSKEYQFANLQRCVPVSNGLSYKPVPQLAITSCRLWRHNAAVDYA